MKTHLLFFVLLLSFVVSGCATKCPPLTDSQKVDIEKQILKIANDLRIFSEKLDVNSYANFISSDEFIAAYSGGSAIRSRKEWIDRVGVSWSERKSQEVGQVQFKVTVLTSEMVLLDRESVFQATFKDGRNKRFNHAASVIYKKEASGWKVIHIHESIKYI